METRGRLSFNIFCILACYDQIPIPSIFIGIQIRHFRKACRLLLAQCFRQAITLKKMLFPRRKINTIYSILSLISSRTKTTSAVESPCKDTRNCTLSSWVTRATSAQPSICTAQSQNKLFEPTFEDSPCQLKYRQPYCASA